MAVGTSNLAFLFVRYIVWLISRMKPSFFA